MTDAVNTEKNMKVSKKRRTTSCTLRLHFSIQRVVFCHEMCADVSMFTSNVSQDSLD